MNEHALVEDRWIYQAKRGNQKKNEILACEARVDQTSGECYQIETYILQDLTSEKWYHSVIAFLCDLVLYILTFDLIENAL